MGAARTDAGTAFNDMIQADRMKRKHEALAKQMLGSGRQTSTTSARFSGRVGPGASLTSRVGVTKRSSSSTPISKANIEQRWGHDLHHHSSLSSTRVMQPPRAKSPLQVEREKRLYANLQNESTTNGVSSQFNVRKPSDVQMSIKGMAASGPYVVVASNFAPGTTAADIEAAMVPVGGEITTCHLISAHPTVIVEIVFVEKEGAENVIATFNNQKADGRLLYVCMKSGGPSPMHKPQPMVVSSAPTPRGPVSRDPTPRAPEPIKPAVPDNRDLMDVDDERPVRAEIPTRPSRDRQLDTRNGRRAEPEYRDGRYGFPNQYDGRDRRDYRGGRDQGRLYSDSVQSRGDPWFRPR